MITYSAVASPSDDPTTTWFGVQETTFPVGRLVKATDHCVRVSYHNAMVSFAEPGIAVSVPPTPPRIGIAVSAPRLCSALTTMVGFRTEATVNIALLS